MIKPPIPVPNNYCFLKVPISTICIEYFCIYKCINYLNIKNADDHIVCVKFWIHTGDIREQNCWVSFSGSCPEALHHAALLGDPPIADDQGLWLAPWKPEVGQVQYGCWKWAGLSRSEYTLDHIVSIK